MKAGRNVLGVEIDPEYYEMAVRRVRDSRDLLTKPLLKVIR